MHVEILEKCFPMRTKIVSLDKNGRRTVCAHLKHVPREKNLQRECNSTR